MITQTSLGSVEHVNKVFQQRMGTLAACLHDHHGNHTHLHVETTSLLTQAGIIITDSLS